MGRAPASPEPHSTPPPGPPASVQLGEDALGQRAADPRHARDVVHARRLHAADAAEVREQRLPLARRRCRRSPAASTSSAPCARRARWPWIAKRCASSRICCSRCRPGWSDGRLSTRVAVGKHDVLLARACARVPWRCRSAARRAAPAPPARRPRRPPAPCRRRSPAGPAPDTRRRRCARSGASAPRASPRSRRRPAPASR